ncbi:MAG: hypothetical protein MJZ39_00600 [Bacteroidales bacterium]|nr:hypothetical protein [Bacteroidales bacterium]
MKKIGNDILVGSTGRHYRYRVRNPNGLHPPQLQIHAAFTLFARNA